MDMDREIEVDVAKEMAMEMELEMGVEPYKGRDGRWKMHDVLWDSFVCFGRPGEVNALCDFFVIFMRFFYITCFFGFCDASFVNGWIPV
jgi:hypothetical protein